MPNVPGTTDFPAALDSATTLLNAVNNASGALQADIGASSTSLTIDAGLAIKLPSAGVVTVDAEAIIYTGKAGATLTGLVRGADGTTAATHAQGAVVAQRVVAAFHNVLRAALIAIEAKLGAGATAPAAGKTLRGTSAGSVWDDDLTRLVKTAGANLGGHRAVYVSSGAAYYADASQANAGAVAGITTGAAALGAEVTIIAVGEVEEPSWAWTPEAPVFLSTNGQLTQTSPTSGSVVIIGYALTPTRLLVRIQQPIGL